MYQTIREYQTNQHSVAEILAQDEKGFVPLISNATGFREYTRIDSGNGVVTSTSVFANRADGESTKAQRTRAFTDARPSAAAVERAKALYLAQSGATRL